MLADRSLAAAVLRLLERESLWHRRGVNQPATSSSSHVLRQSLVTLLAAGLAVALMIGVYMLVPVPQGDDPPWSILVVIVVAILVYVAAGVWGLVRIRDASHPLRTGMILLSIMLTAIVVTFALSYLSLSVDNPANFNEPLDKVSSLYFTMTILATVGFGDIVARSHPAMIAVMIQMVAGLTLITVLVRVIGEAARRAAEKKREDLPD